MLRLGICDYSDAYIVVTGEITFVKKVFSIAIVATTNKANTNNAL